jgi:peptide-methionine (S)-S-oxide reductase
MFSLSSLLPLIIQQTRLINTCSMVSNKIALGAGCYWGTEKFIVKDFQKTHPNSIQSAAVGFMAPDPKAMKNPTYRQVCSGSTGHVEVLDVTLSNPQQDLEALLRFFYQFHDPTTMNRQGNDAGTQYASVVFVHDDEQERIAKKVTADLQKLVDAGQVKYAGKEIKTQIVKANEFYPAHEEHQAYLEKNPGGYCNHYYRFKQWPELN